MTLFQLVTLPVEYDASRRAKEQLFRLGLVHEDERAGVSKVLDAAALTYVAALVSSMLTLLYYITARARQPELIVNFSCGLRISVLTFCPFYGGKDQKAQSGQSQQRRRKISRVRCGEPSRRVCVPEPADAEARRRRHHDIHPPGKLRVTTATRPSSFICAKSARSNCSRRRRKSNWPPASRRATKRRANR